MSDVIRLCASFITLPRDECVVPERCVDRECRVCGTKVHYDPKSRIDALGEEFIVCSGCFEALMEGVEPWPAELHRD
jgi:hypothetical protein